MILIDERQGIQRQTWWLRTSPFPFCQRLRQLLSEKGIDVANSYVVKLFPDGTSMTYVMIMTREAKFFRFYFDQVRKPASEGHITEWEAVIGDASQIFWKEEVEIALTLLENDRHR